MTMIDNQTVLREMREALDAYVAGTLPLAALLAAWRERGAALRLPPAFGRVSEALLRRLEMSASFAVDSCSFSSAAVTDQMREWLDQADKAAV
jgi:hypothetical protein